MIRWKLKHSFILITIPLTTCSICPDPADPGCCLEYVIFTAPDGTEKTLPLGFNKQTNTCAWPEGSPQAGAAYPSSSTQPTSPPPPPLVPTPTNIDHNNTTKKVIELIPKANPLAPVITHPFVSCGLTLSVPYTSYLQLLALIFLYAII